MKKILKKYKTPIWFILLTIASMYVSTWALIRSYPTNVLIQMTPALIYCGTALSAVSLIGIWESDKRRKGDK